MLKFEGKKWTSEELKYGTVPRCNAKLTDIENADSIYKPVAFINIYHLHFSFLYTFNASRM